MRPYCRSASQPAGAALRVARSARWRPARRLLTTSCRQAASERGMSAPQDQQLGHASRAGSRCDRPCGRPRRPRPSAASPSSDRSRTPVLARCAAPKNSLSSAWNFTSSRRAVLSARSRKVPMREKWNASSCSIVPTRHAARQVRAELDPLEDLRRVALEARRREHALQLEPGLVLRLPDLGGERAAHRARVLARRHAGTRGSTRVRLVARP